MAVHLHNSQLRVVQKYAKEQRNRLLLANSRILLIEHILPTTEEFINQITGAGADVSVIFAKPYSIDEEVFKRLSTRFKVVRKTYEDLEDPTAQIIDRYLVEALDKSKKDNKSIVLIDVGGYFSEPLLRLSGHSEIRRIVGVVEDTTFGHNRYLKSVQKLPTKVFSVARSRLKEIEARFVGRDAVIAADAVLRESGVMLSGRNALVLGYGMIGSNVARSLQAHDLTVSVYDKRDHKILRAYIDGFRIHKKSELLKQADIIFSATAELALTYKEIEECKTGVILASVGSKDTEFDVRSVMDQSTRIAKHGRYLDEYVLPNSNSVRVIKDGTAINFLLPSIPIEVLDLVFSEIFICLMLLLKQEDQYSMGVLNTATESHLNAVSLDWLRFVNK